MSNIFDSFMSSYAVSGSFTRSGLNFESGTRTTLYAIFTAIILMIIVLLIAPLTAYLPIAAMADVIAYNFTILVKPPNMSFLPCPYIIPKSIVKKNSSILTKNPSNNAPTQNY